MPDPKTTERLRGLMLSAIELKELTDWPDALVEDYLNILDNLILLADTLDVETDKNLEALIYSMPTNKKFESRINELERKLLVLESPKDYKKEIDSIITKIETLPIPKSYEKEIEELGLLMWLL